MDIDLGKLVVIWEEGGEIKDIKSVDYINKVWYRSIKNEDWEEVKDFESDIILEYYEVEDFVKVIYDKRYSKEEVMKEIKMIDIKVRGIY